MKYIRTIPQPRSPERYNQTLPNQTLPLDTIVKAASYGQTVPTITLRYGSDYGQVDHGTVDAKYINNMLNDSEIEFIKQSYAPTGPAPTDPVPTDPAPADPVPTDPAPTDPDNK